MRACRKRPRGCRAAEERDELAAFHFDYPMAMPLAQVNSGSQPPWRCRHWRTPRPFRRQGRRRPRPRQLPRCRPNRHAATHRNHVRDLLQKSVLGLISQILELKRGLAASASRISLEAAKFHGVRIGPVATDGRSDIASLVNDYDGNLIAVLCALLERALNDYERHFHRNVLLDLWSLRTG